MIEIKAGLWEFKCSGLSYLYMTPYLSQGN